jgi:hypothetical protein
MDMRERNSQMHHHKRQEMEGDFVPFYPPESPVTAEMRLAIAAEYAAFQLGQINRKLTALTELLASKT